MTTSMPISVPGGQDIQELLARAERLLERIRRKIQELVTKINKTLTQVPDVLMRPAVVAAVQEGMRQVYDLFDRVVRQMEYFFDSPGWPPRLEEAGDGWRFDVARPAADTEERINAGRMRADDYWKGTAAENYKETLDTQQAAFAAMTDLARMVSGLLSAAAFAITKFWVALVIGLAGAAALAASTVAFFASGFGAPGAVATMIALLLELLVAVGGTWWALRVEMSTVQRSASDLVEETNLNTAFDGDRWPRATAEGTWKAD